MINLQKAQNLLQKYNEQLATICGGNLVLVLDTYTNIIETYPDAAILPKSRPEFVLCLMHINRCISSIACKINKLNASMEISSQTSPEHEGKKYNLLLRSVCFGIAKSIKFNKPISNKTRYKPSRSSSLSNKPRQYSVKTIISRAINPISTFTLVKYFNAYNRELYEYLDNKELSLDLIKTLKYPFLMIWTKMKH